MFFLRYLRRELLRRVTRTVLSGLALAIGVALVIDVAALGTALHGGQAQILNPLASIGSDLLVTRSLATAVATTGGLPPATTAQTPPATDLDSDFQSVVTDLSTLGNPGDHFAHDFFLPSGEQTMPAATASAVSRLRGVSATATGLTLQVVHQEGTVPKIVAELKQAARTLTVVQQISPLTPGEQTQIQDCMRAAQRAGHTDEATLTNCLPARFRSAQLTVNIPALTIQQVVKPPQTDITSSSYTIAGVDPSERKMGIVTPAQVTAGRFLQPGAAEALLSDGYARRQGLARGQSLTIHGATFQVVGVIKPPLAGQAADVYLPLADLQKISGRSDRVNVLLVRAAGAGDVARVTAEIKRQLPDAQVTASGDLAAQVSGSLVDARNLVDRAGAWLVGLVLVGTLVTTCLLTLAAIGRRVRELGTLRALGWSSVAVVRQVLAECLALGLLGALIGSALSLAVLVIASQVIPPLSAVGPSVPSSPSLFGLGTAAPPVFETVRLRLSADPVMAALASLLAIGGGLLAGAVGGVRAARLRPADALRELG